MKKTIRNSLIITIIYFILSEVIFSMGGLPDIGVLNPIEDLLILPAMLGFGYGYGGGLEAAIPALILTFLMVWVFLLLVLTIFSSIKKNQVKPS